MIHLVRKAGFGLKIERFLQGEDMRREPCSGLILNCCDSTPRQM